MKKKLTQFQRNVFKSALVGVAIGGVWLMIVAAGAFACNWNPVCAGAFKSNVLCHLWGQIFRFFRTKGEGFFIMHCKTMRYPKKTFAWYISLVASKTFVKP